MLKVAKARSNDSPWTARSRLGSIEVAESIVVKTRCNLHPLAQNSSHVVVLSQDPGFPRSAC